MKTPTRRKIEVRAVRPNAGIQAAYRKALLAQIELMHNSLEYWLAAQYRANPPAMDAPDGGIGSILTGSSATAMSRQMKRLGRRWLKNFDRAAERLALWFSQKAINRSQEQLQRILRDGGVSVKFQMTEAARNAYEAVRAENVGLIRSIAQQHLTQVEGIVMRSVAAGRDLATASRELQAQFGVTKRRAALIARDQNNKATAVITKVRQRELGITHARWQHSHAGKHPRKSHLDFDGQVYDIEKGAYLDGKWVWPGTEINCRCVSKSIIEGFIE